MTTWKREIDYIFLRRIFNSKKSTHAKILTEWKSALMLHSRYRRITYIIESLSRQFFYYWYYYYYFIFSFFNSCFIFSFYFFIFMIIFITIIITIIFSGLSLLFGVWHVSPRSHMFFQFSPFHFTIFLNLLSNYCTYWRSIIIKQKQRKKNKKIKKIKVLQNLLEKNFSLAFNEVAGWKFSKIYKKNICGRVS